MKSIITITSLLLMVVSLNAQQMAQPVKINGKDIYALSLVNEEFISVESVKITEQEINSTKSIEERIQLFINKATSKSFDAIMTRIGTSATLIKYKNPTGNTLAKLTDTFEKDIYFLAVPLKKFKQIQAVELDKTDYALSFNQLVEKYISQATPKIFDALLIENKQIKYIVYE
ncbi:MAG TPA: hypothetical protein PK649_09355 [Vicingus sp.]|jgi:hypothetical protein|nr:hypothetical protein [Flavobacteriales bacterium]MBV6484092.1 hypothetical protein [Flavobacteriales bacterium]HRN42264.1 hypothetical protein [Vicingus sp.]